MLILFPAFFSEKYFLLFEVPLFHLAVVIALIIKGILVVELVVELGWNYVKFHPNSTYNSTSSNALILRWIISPWWKGGITNDIKYF